MATSPVTAVTSHTVGLEKHARREPSHSPTVIGVTEARYTLYRVNRKRSAGLTRTVQDPVPLPGAVSPLLYPRCMVKDARETHEKRLARWAAQGRAGSDPVAAATVVLVRDGADGLESLMLRRNSKIAFGGMWVFPGGRVDPGDRLDLSESDDLEAARRAAVRESAEEAGLEIPLESLVPFSHWTPPPITPKRYLTWFFVAAAPAAQVVIDRGEIHEHEWMRPVDALRRRDERQIELAPPTWITLFELSRWSKVDEALAAVQRRTLERFETHIGIVDEGAVALWHGDAGWESGDPSVSGARHRLSMYGARWHYERTK